MTDLFDNVPAPVKEATQWLLKEGDDKLPEARKKFALSSQETADALLLTMKARTAAEEEKYDPFKEDEVVPVQCPTAVFVNANNGVTIMQDQTANYGERDVMIVLSSKQAVQAVIRALQQKLEEM